MRAERAPSARTCICSMSGFGAASAMGWAASLAGAAPSSDDATPESCAVDASGYEVCAPPSLGRSFAEDLPGLAEEGDDVEHATPASPATTSARPERHLRSVIPGQPPT